MTGERGDSSGFDGGRNAKRLCPMLSRFPPNEGLDSQDSNYRIKYMSTIEKEFNGVTAVTKANVYFDGKVVSHTILFADDSKKTLGLIYPGKFHFGTDKAERMEITAGSCRVKIDGSSQETTYNAGQYFDVQAKSGFDIEVAGDICEYICSFIG